LKDDENKKTISIIQMISNKIDNNKKKQGLNMKENK
jgi:hypothetical protein